MIPLVVDPAGKRILVFGGGSVAARKAAYFAGKADVIVVSRSFAKPFLALPVTRLTRDVQEVTDAELEGFMEGMFAVIAALPDKGQNDRIGAICRKKGILFNNADGTAGDLILPAVSSGSYYTIAVTTHGRSPAVSRFIREHIDEQFRMLDQMIALQETLRRDLKQTSLSQEQRSAILMNVMRDAGIWEALAHSVQEAEMMARRKYLHG